MAHGPTHLRALFSDIGGVLGTNGWDSGLRRKVCAHFELDFDEIEPRHRLMFDSYERGYMTFDEYLDLVFFANRRSFTAASVREFALNGSQPWPENIEFIRKIRHHNRLKLGLISNEGEGITAHRIEKFGLRELADFMVISHFTGLRKPDREIWHLALHLAGVKAEESVYIDDRPAFAQAARHLGFSAIHYQNLNQTAEEFEKLGLTLRDNE